MTRSEATKKIFNKFVQRSLDLFLGKDSLGIAFEKAFGELGEWEKRGVQIYDPSLVSNEFTIVCYMAAVYSLLAHDKSPVRFDLLCPDIQIAFGAAATSGSTLSYEQIRRHFNDRVIMYKEYLTGVSSTGPYFTDIIRRAGVPFPSDTWEITATAYRLWLLEWFEHLLLGDYYKKERQGDLCFRFLPVLEELSAYMEKVVTEFCGTVETQRHLQDIATGSANKGRATGCLVPLLLAMGTLTSFIFLVVLLAV